MAKRKALESPAEKKSYPLSIPEALLDQCRVRAMASKRSLNAQLEWLIETGLMVDEERVMPARAHPVAAHAE